MKSDEIVLDTSSGISVEEQQQILTQINEIAEKNRRSLSENTAGLQDGVYSKAFGKKYVINAKKGGAVFPLAVNIAAVAALCAGVFLLISFNGRMDAQIRTGNAVYDSTERALIEEIRRDTAQRIAAKEREIALIVFRMEEVGSQLLQLFSSNEELTAEQLAAQERLHAIQASYSEELSVLQDERSEILEDSRAREAGLRAQFEERTTEFTAEQQRTSGELERLTNEQERIAAIDAQISGGLVSVGDLIQNGHFDQAARNIANLRQLTNNNTLVSSHAFQSRRIFYNQSLDLAETLLADARRGGGAASATDTASEQSDLAARNEQLEDRIAEMQDTINALRSGGSDQARMLAELDSRVSSLRNENSTLHNENTAMHSENTTLRNENTAQRNENTTLRNENTALERRTAENTERISSLETIRANIASENTELRSANAALNRTISERDNQITSLNNQLTAIRQLLQD